MKINTSIESYNIKALSEIGASVIALNQQCQLLEALGQFVKVKLASAATEFDSINYERTQEAVDSYIKKSTVAQAELAELADSVKAFQEKISHIWS